MQVRTVVARIVAVTLLTFGSVAVATPAAVAGTGSSQTCNDGIGTREAPILNSPVTVGVELFASPTSANNLFILCFSTTPYGQPGGIGGAIFVFYGADGSVTDPGVGVYISCRPDAGSAFWPACELPAAGVEVVPGDRPTVEAPPTGICLVNVDGQCRAFAPGLRLRVGGDGRDTALITILGVNVPVNLPAHCVAVLLPC